MEHFRAFLRAMFSSRRLRHTERMKRFRKEKICGWRDFEGWLGVTPEPGRIRRSSAIRSSFDMKLKTLEDLFLHELKDLFSAENQLVKALPKMAKAATNEELKAGFEEHLEQTRGHVERLEEIGEMLGKKLGGHKCKAMEGLVEEGAELISEDAEDAIRDAGLIGAAQRVEHYEMAGYGTARTLALHLGHEDAADLLEQTLDEERETNEKLTELAEMAISAEVEHSAEQ
jgi:ferritin-like metal-binding protein YciE